jgi:hypothetical protein
MMDILVIGGFALWASRAPLEHLSAAWFIVRMEAFHGIVNDVFLISRGCAAADDLVFIVIPIIIFTGVIFARQALAKT